MDFLKDIFKDIIDKLNTALIVEGRWKMLLGGLGNTLVIAFFALIIGVILGIIVAVIKVAASMNKKSKILAVLDFLSNIYINLIRGTPVVVQLMIMYYVILVSTTNSVLVAIISFGLNSGAYVAEIMRAGIQAVDKGQTEAGRSLGLSSLVTMKEIVLPQAIKNILPALANEFITLLKETSIAGYVAISDLTKAGDRIRYSTYDPFTALLIVAGIYLVLVLGLARLFSMLEKGFAAVKTDNITNGKVLIKTIGLHKSFGNHVLRESTKRFSRGEKVVIIGPSGGGKSTFLRSLNLLEEPSAVRYGSMASA